MATVSSRDMVTLKQADPATKDPGLRPAAQAFRPVAALRTKYAMDRLLSVALLLVLSPLALLTVLAITLEALANGERPQVFVSERRLSAGRGFRLVKFRIFWTRSLRSHRENPQPPSLKALETPEHLTRTGRLLQRFYLDEAPQLLNVARGEMSLVGPRPYFEGDWHREPRLDIPARRLLKAGLVGPFQAVKAEVSGLDSVNVLDTEYLQLCLTASPFALFLKDLDLIRRSLLTVVRGEGL